MVLLESSENISVVGIARRETPIDHKNFKGYKCDLTNIKELVAIFQTIKADFPGKKIQILINNAGFLTPVTIPEVRN